MARLNVDLQKKLEPKRLAYCKREIEALGFIITKETEVEIQFVFNGNTISMWPYSGWHSGKGIKAGRGINKLLNQIKPQ